MTNQHETTSPVLAYLKQHGVLIGVTAVILGSAGVFVASQVADASSAAPAPKPTVQSTAGFGADTVAGASPSASAGATGSATASGASASPGAVSGASTAPQITPTGSAQARTQATPYPQTTVTVGTGPQAPTEQDWTINAKAFAAAWANPGVGKDAWLAAIRPHVTDSLYKMLQLTDIRSVPTETLQGVSQDRHSGGALVYHPLFSSSKNQFQGLMKIQPNGVWLVDQLDSPAKS